MNTALPEILHFFNANGSSTDMTVLERQRARRKWQEQRPQSPEKNMSSYGCFTANEFSGMFSSPIQATQVQSFQGLMGGTESALGSLKPDPGFDIVWPELEMPRMEFESSGLIKGITEFEATYSVSRASTCKPAMAAPTTTEKMNSAAGRESFKKRKAEKIQNDMVCPGEDIKEKKIKSNKDETESKITDQNSNKTNNNLETSADTSKENSKASEIQKQDYIHVRARRGQATDSHSLAERVRREKISERMRYLQDLVPGCNKITGKAGMLDEIINYVQSLQRQVEFLSMKLATLNPRLDFNVDELFAKEVFPSSNFPNLGISSGVNDSAYSQFNPLQQMLPCSGLEMTITPSDIGLRRTISAPISFIPETFADSSCFTVISETLPQIRSQLINLNFLTTNCQFQPSQPPSTWNADLQNFYSGPFDQGRSTTFPSHPFTGSMEASSLKMEM